MYEHAAKWEERFSRPGYWIGAEPAPFLQEILPLLGPPGCALELAMGEGRNSVFLAEQGWRVTGVELTTAGIAKAEGLARERKVQTWRTPPGGNCVAPSAGVLLQQGDLTQYPLPTGPWDLVLIVNFLIRPVLPAILQALPPGCLLAYETFTVRQLEFEGGPRSREFLLEPGELREAFGALDILIYREWTAGKGMASLLARKADKA